MSDRPPPIVQGRVGSCVWLCFKCNTWRPALERVCRRCAAVPKAPPRRKWE